MSRKELTSKAKKTTNRAWDVVNLVSAAIGGAILSFTAETPKLVADLTVGQIVGAVLLATVMFRVAHLVYTEQR